MITYQILYCNYFKHFPNCDKLTICSHIPPFPEYMLIFNVILVGPPIKRRSLFLYPLNLGLAM